MCSVLPDLFRSTRLRLSALYLGLITAIFAAALLGAWAATRNAATNDVRERIAAEADIIRTAFAKDGSSGAARAIKDRTAYPTTFIYRLSDARGGVLAGEPDLEIGAPGWRFEGFDLNAPGAVRGDKLIYSEQLGDGVILTIADDMERPERIRDAVMLTQIWIGLGALVFSVLAAHLATRSLFTRMAQLSRTVALVAQGDDSVRAPERRLKHPDDLDQLVGSFNQMLDRIDTLIASVKRVSMNVAHDLRTPLTRVHRRLDAARAAGSDSARADEIAAAQHEINDLLRTSEALLGLAEIQSGALRVGFSPVALGAIVEQVADAYRPDLEAAGIALDLSIGEAPEISGDPNLLTRALSNLVENIMQHGAPATHASIDLRQSGDSVRLRVKDDGAGVPETERQRVLQPFERRDVSRTTPGAGLGLSIVSAIAKLHGASIALEDCGPGLSVTLAFPGARG